MLFFGKEEIFKTDTKLKFTTKKINLLNSKLY